jgi:2'-5' RNA ligase
LKYLVAHLLSGDASAFHRELARDLSLRFHTIPLHERIPAHITIKPPFEADESRIGDVERILRAFALGERAAPLTFRGFGRFGFRTVYLDVYKSPDAVSLVRRAVKTLNDNASWLPQSPLEGNKLHASVARFLSRHQSRHIWRFLKECSYPHFDSALDNIAILKKDGRVWSVHALIPLRAYDQGFWYHEGYVRKEIQSVG